MFYPSAWFKKLFMWSCQQFCFLCSGTYFNAFVCIISSKDFALLFQNFIRAIHFSYSRFISLSLPILFNLLITEHTIINYSRTCLIWTSTGSTGQSFSIEGVHMRVFVIDEVTEFEKDHILHRLNRFYENRQ